MIHHCVLCTADVRLSLRLHSTGKAIANSTTKGFRFQSPGGIGGPIISDLHPNLRVGLKEDWYDWFANQAANETNAAGGWHNYEGTIQFDSAMGII